MLVKPAADLTIRDPDLHDYLPAEGRDVPDTEYWQRRLADKDVELGEPAHEVPAPAPAPAPAPDHAPAPPVAPTGAAA